MLIFRRALSSWRPPVFDPLPPVPIWPDTYGQPKDRAFLHNTNTANEVAAGFLAGATKPKTIIEAYPGIGILSRALLQHPPSVVKSLVLLEDDPKLLPALEALQKVDNRVVVVPRSGFEWATYTHLESRQLLPNAPTPWEEEAPLQFVAHLPHTTHGEQLISQLFRTIPDRHWLFKFGRVRLSCVLPTVLNERITAQGISKQRCKLSVVASSTCSWTEAVKPEMLSPYAANLYPLIQASVKRTSVSARASTPHVAINYDPLQNQLIQKGDTDKWDFILRTMYIRKTMTLRKVMPSLAPGAENLIKTLTSPDTPETDRVDINTPITKLSPEDWANVVKAFNGWKFAPKITEL